ncbi:hypothetical protein TMEN_5055 [Trichophyton mentagrophytes]|nr:hypothetical protein TMEN_5055 [Trichophyton mentagrophytes]
MSAAYVSSQFIQNVIRGSRVIAVEFVDKTTAWIRPAAFPATNVKSDFMDVVEKNLDSLRPNTAIVAMKESEHKSDSDMRMHFTAYKLDKNRNILITKHFVASK